VRALTRVPLAVLSLYGLAADWKGGMKNSAESKSATPPGKSGEGAQYGVHYLPGDIERVIFTKRDEARSLCVQVTLTSPGDLEPAPSGELQLPAGWSLQRAIAVPDAAACRATTRRRPADAIDATEVAGVIRWGNSPTDGTEVDFRLSFPALGASPAFSERLKFKR
jgi:hypothetical protein